MPCKQSSTRVRRITRIALLAGFVLPLALSNCGKKSGDNNNNGCCGDQSLKPTANLQNAFGLLVIQDSPSATLALMQRHNTIVDRLQLPALKFDDVTSDTKADELGLVDIPYTLDGLPFSFPTSNGLNLDGTATGSSGSSGGDTGTLSKIDKTTGEIGSALTVPAQGNQNNGPSQKLPMIKTIAVSPTKDVYLHFNQPFTYRDTTGASNAYDQTAGYQCQIFKVNGGTLDQLLTTAPSANNLVCLDNKHFINNWGTSSNGVFQFDSGGNVYYPGTSPNSPQTVVYKRLRDGSATTEVINSNICPQNFLVSKLGGVFYTGNTCSNGNNSNMGGNNGYFRYVAPGTGSNVIEIARNWSQFIFNSSVADDNAGKSYDNAVFFGPYSTDGTTPSWSSACLFKFNGDPSITDATQRVSAMLSCGASQDIYGWMNLTRNVDIGSYGCSNWYFGCPGCGGPNQTTACNTVSLWNKTGWVNEFTSRCQAKDKVFAGGGSQISAIKQDNTGTIYVIGAIQKKVAGQVTCSVDIRGPHCVINSMPYLTDPVSNATYTKTSCNTANGTWIDVGNCNGNQMSSPTCLAGRSWVYDGTHTTGPVTGLPGKCYLTSDIVNNTNSSTATALTTYTSDSACNQASTAGNYGAWVQFNPQDVNYSSVTTSICLQDDYATQASKALTNPTPTQAQQAENTARSTNWNSNTYNSYTPATAVTANGTSVTTKFLINGFNCQQSSTSGSSGSSGSNNSWTSEYQSMAMVDSTTQALVMLSLPTEQAINLWLVDNTPYYSSYDTNLRQYLLNTITVDAAGSCVNLDKNTAGTCTGTNLSWKAARRVCVNTAYTLQADCEKNSLTWHSKYYPQLVMSNFEAYNVAKGSAAGSIYADGLDFSNNTYKFGTVDVASGVLTMKAGITGTLQTIVILPQ